MEEQELRCPWCGGLWRRGSCGATAMASSQRGVKVATHNIFKRVTEKEKCIWFRNWVDNPPAYACRSCRKIILPY